MEVVATQETPLTPDFVQWWFAPWEYGCSWPGDLALPQGLVGRRDGYALWCEHAWIQADFPARVEVLWQGAALREGQQLEEVARLFVGLLAARENDLKALQSLDPQARRWCMSIAALQPLLALAGGPLADGNKADLLQRGLLEIRAWLELGFPGMWSRLRHLLSWEAAQALEQQPAVDKRVEDLSSGAIKRAQRCWQLCTDRVQASLDEDMTGSDEESGLVGRPAGYGSVASSLGSRPPAGSGARQAPTRKAINKRA